MTAPAVGTVEVWVLILALGVGCFALRLSFIQVHGWLGEFPPWLDRALVYLPPAILAALAMTFLLDPDGSLLAAVGLARGIAAAVAVVIAWRTRSVLATVVGGMVALWLVRFVVL